MLSAKVALRYNFRSNLTYLIKAQSLSPSVSSILLLDSVYTMTAERRIKFPSGKAVYPPTTLSAQQMMLDASNVAHRTATCFPGVEDEKI